MDRFAHKYLYAENKIKNSIRNFEVHTKLHGERTFAEELGISYMTVRKAVENLVDDGVLYKIREKAPMLLVGRPWQGKQKISEGSSWVGSYLSFEIMEGRRKTSYLAQILAVSVLMNPGYWRER